MRGFEHEPIDWAPASVWTNDDGVTHKTLEFIVPGRPVSKGSVVKGRWGGYHDTAKGIDDWLAAIQHQAAVAMEGAYRRRAEMFKVPAIDKTGPVVLSAFSSAVMVDATFVLRRPKSTIIDGKRWDLTKPETPPHIKKPDSDKLVRAVLDAMTGIVYNDDAQVVEHHARKRLADIGETPGAIILVTSNVRVE